MGKKLVFNYTFDASAQTVRLDDDIYSAKRLLLITNTTTGDIIYQFNDANLGIANIAFDYENTTTTLTLNFDTTSMNDTDVLQILVEMDSADMTVNERFVDPVSKIRVSNPENLIDTDFEYGLQSTKWETLELTKNIPTFFSRSGDIPIELTSIDTINGSDQVQVVTAVDHGLRRGTPIIVQATANIACDGGFVVDAVIDNTTFTYTAKNQVNFTGNVVETFSQLFPASVYAGTEFKLSNIGGITTNEAAQSVLTVSTQFPNDFENGTSMALSNSFAKATINIDTDQVEFNNYTSLNKSTTSNAATGETGNFVLGGVHPFNWQPTDGYYFTEGTTSVDTNNNVITTPTPHGFTTGQAITYLTDTGTNTAIGGLTSGKTYYVVRINDTSFYLHNYRSTSSFYRTNLSSNGVSGGISKGCFARAFWQYYQYSFEQNRLLNGTFNWSPFTGDVKVDFGSSVANAPAKDRPLFATDAWTLTQYADITGDIFRGNNTSSYDWFFQQYYTSGFASTYSVRVYSTTSFGYYNISSGSYNVGWLPFLPNPTGCSFYVANHGLTTGDAVTITATSGTLPSPVASGTVYKAVVIDANRISLQTLAGADIVFTNGGTTNLAYQVTAYFPLENQDTIFVPDTTLKDGDAVVYSNNGGTDIGGLTNGSTYYVAFKNGSRFMLSTTANTFGDSYTIANQGLSSSVDLTNDYIDFDSTALSTGDAVRYTTTSTPIGGLSNGQIFWVRFVSGQDYTLHYSKSDATSNANKVNLGSYGTGTGVIQKLNIIDLTSKPSGETHIFTADFVGAADGLYSVASSAADGLSFTFNAGDKIEARSVSSVSQKSFIAGLNAFRINNHGLITGDSVEYTETGTTNVSGLSSGSSYFIIRKNKDFFSLATSQENAILGTAIALSDSGGQSSEITGTVSFAPTSIVGEFNGDGTISYEADSLSATGEDTNFTSFYNKGDSFFISIPETTVTATISSVNTSSNVITTSADHNFSTGDAVRFETTGSLPSGLDADDIYFVRVTAATTFTVHYTATNASGNSGIVNLTNAGSNSTVIHIDDAGSTLERIVDYVNSNVKIEFSEALPSTAQTDINYLQRTSLLLRPDGFALHRPYDGGVELIPSTNPDSQMVRQTRKYFRYQSGKGIQVSFAVNFSPTSQIDTFTRIGAVGSIKTRFPHRLSTGLNIVTSGSTNTNQDVLGTINKTVVVTQNDDAQNKFTIDNSYDTFTLLEGRTYRFDMSDSSLSGHPMYFSSDPAALTDNTVAQYTTGVTENYASNPPGTSGSYIEIAVAASAPTLYTMCGVHNNMGQQVNTDFDASNNRANLWNGTLAVASIVDDYNFTVTLDGTPSDVSATGIIEYYVNGWERSSLRCGLFDDQNGLFFEYDGQKLQCCRRSSIQQISGFANVEFRSSKITGVDTQFANQLNVGEKIVIKGQTHVISKIDSNNLMYVTPSYRGVTADKVVVTKTNDTKVPQGQWNLDICDGTGETGFNLDINRIQMAYIDYSWYGAGKVRFGFKDQHGNVRYVHSFVHGNFFTEAYMRSGNIPARYEIENIGLPTYVPALAHWGTSVIMDGRFDADEAYIFNATSPNITLTGAASVAAQAKVEFTGQYYQRLYNRNWQAGFAILLDSSDPALSSVAAGTPVTGADLAADTVTANPISNLVFPFQPYLPSITSRQGTSFATQATRSLLLINKQPTGTTGSSSTYTIGTAGQSNITDEIPLISVRLAPSVDTSAPGFLGEREIINRMQLILNSVGILSTHGVTIRLVLNGLLSSNAWERVTNPSLSQLILHTNEDTINGGLSVFNFEAQGGTGTTGRTPVLTTSELGSVTTLGNSILGGDGVFPDGPDVVTVTARLAEDPSTVASNNPFQISGRLSWSESQA